VTLYRGVYPIPFSSETTDHAQVNRDAIDELVRRGAVREGDLVIITKGDLIGVHGGSNAMKIVRVGELAPTNSA
jgi:pyruvate kinase